jgi:hypothetical protein
MPPSADGVLARQTLTTIRMPLALMCAPAATHALDFSAEGPRR